MVNSGVEMVKDTQYNIQGQVSWNYQREQGSAVRRIDKLNFKELSKQ
jgi:hypothetical protein